MYKGFSLCKKVYQPNDNIEKAKARPFKEIKLYYIAGLPTETDDDMKEFTDGISQIAGNLNNKLLSVSLNAFIPKPLTPLGHYPMESDEALKKRFSLIKEFLRLEKNVKLTINYSDTARLEALIGLSGESITPVLKDSANGVPLKKALGNYGINLSDEIFGI
jgi:radical SAM superfamily enzyme YgiQ (UPF0313 family)